MTKITVNENKEAKPKDIFYKGNIVISNDEEVIVVVTDDQNTRDSFSGFVLQDTKCKERQSAHIKDWLKKCFEQFHGSIVLEA